MSEYLDPPVGAGPPTTLSSVPSVSNSSGGDRMRPDVTKVQVIALVQAILALLIAFGIDLSAAQTEAILTLSGQLGIALVLADAGLRGARNLSDRR